MESEPKRKRRWFQFSLRTLLIGVTLLAGACGYVGWQAKIVKERREGVHWINGLKRHTWMNPALQRPTWIRGLFGDVVYCNFVLADSAPQESVEQIKSLYPEAMIYRESDVPSLVPRNKSSRGN